MKILLAGGGTGGHVMPALAVAHALTDKVKDVQLLYVGSQKPSDREPVEAAGLEFRAIRAGKLRRYFSWQNVSDFFRFLSGISDARRILREFQPDVIFAKGGYVALPVVWAARGLGIPVVVHESDSRLGLTNTLSAASADKIAVSFPIDTYIKSSAKLAKFKDKFVYTGLPIPIESRDSARRITFDNKRPTVALTGGSQGALVINQAIFKALPELLQKYNVIHQTGRLSFETAQIARRGLPKSLQDNYKIFDFCLPEEYFAVIRSADVVVARAGSSIFDILAVGKPMVLIPLPGSANNHQHYNAVFFAKQEAAVVLDQKDLTPETLLQAIEQMVEDKKMSGEFAANAEKLGKMNEPATDRIVELIINLATHG